VITAVDTNVLLDVFGADPKFAPASSEALRDCLREGALVASEVVWAETATVFGEAGRFLIGAHALVTADRLLTRDRGFYRRYFSGLRIIDPTAAR
jgi:predicted nucleic acid-binding protein